MALRIEDGSLVTDANSYNAVAEIVAYALERGFTLPSDEAVIEAWAVKATDYLSTFEQRYVGMLVDPDQSLSWPRKGVFKSDGSVFPENEIPKNLKKAESQLVIEQFNGIDLMPSVEGSEGFITREKVDVIEVQYSQRIVPTSQPRMPLVDALLETLLVPTPALRSYRV